MYCKLVSQNQNLKDLEELEGALSKDTFEEKKIKVILHYGRYPRRMNLFW